MSYILRTSGGEHACGFMEEIGPRYVKNGKNKRRKISPKIHLVFLGGRAREERRAGHGGFAVKENPVKFS